MSIQLAPSAEQLSCRGAQPVVVRAMVARAGRVSSVARERFAADFSACSPDGRALLVRTCHRVEVYFAAGADGIERLPEPPAGCEHLMDVEAVRHLISVACGLDSAVLGEDAVLHQIREAYTSRCREVALDPALDRLFQVALRAGRSARSWLPGPRPSLGDAALDEIESVSGNLTGKHVLVVGAGTMGRLAARAAAARGARVFVANRTRGRAEALARAVGGDTADWTGSPPPQPLAGVVVAIAGTWTAALDMAPLVTAGGTVIVDLSSPPAMPMSLQLQLGGRCVSIDDLAWRRQASLPESLLTRIDALVHESGHSYCRWLRTRDSGSTMVALAETVEERCTAELEWLVRRLGDSQVGDGELIRQASHRLTASILHSPRRAISNDETSTLESAARELFGL
ncbi:MAG: hypothetical protein U0990_08515 [Candidatus Nanopelagicales bacterium]|nr:hypothetical protein [Candidatus Nanopelagicales bacterium]MDZ4250119.1 hypothetical protein [Candidatus Nanopelagicales bacterium]